MNTNLSFNNMDREKFVKNYLKEDFLHYIWKFKLFELNDLKTVDEATLTILKSGYHNKDSGADFFNGLVTIDDQLWAGNIEIHLKSSDWYAHKHEQDANYDAVVLHVVWEYDVPVYYSNQKEIPTVELKDYVDSLFFDSYYRFFSKNEKWILCEDSMMDVDSFIIASWIHRLYFERLERKTKQIFDLLQTVNNDWEAVLFQLLAKSFGMKLNGDAFLSLARSFDYSIVRKCQNKPGDIEILLFGQAGFFNMEMEDAVYVRMKKEYNYLQRKFTITPLFNGEFKFFRLRPNNFPTIRISQLSDLYEQQHNLFSKIIATNEIKEFYKIFDVSTSEYWETHYVFGKETKKRVKQTSNNFTDLLLINVIIPLKYAYGKYLNKNVSNELELLLESIKSESNSIINKYADMGVLVDDALDSQGLLELKENYCDKKRCLDCSIGVQILSAKKR